MVNAVYSAPEAQSCKAQSKLNPDYSSAPQRHNNLHTESYEEWDGSMDLTIVNRTAGEEHAGRTFRANVNELSQLTGRKHDSGLVDTELSEDDGNPYARPSKKSTKHSTGIQRSPSGYVIGEASDLYSSQEASPYADYQDDDETDPYSRVVRARDAADQSHSDGWLGRITNRIFSLW